MSDHQHDGDEVKRDMSIDERHDYPADAWRIILARGARSFAYGLLAVALAIRLTDAGISTVAIGALITVALVGDFAATYVIAIYADRWGRRRTLAGLAALMAATGAIFGLTNAYPALLFTAFFGVLGVTASETAPFLPIEQAMLPATEPPERRASLFARYNLVSTFALALGSLAAGAPGLVARAGLLDETIGVRLIFGVYAALALLVAWLALGLSPAVESPPPRSQAAARADAHAAPPSRRATRPPLVPALGAARGVVLRLATLFSVDAFAGGLVAQSLLALYFHLRFGFSLAPLAGLFFGANLLAALSFLAAARLARRFGLLNTMVFTHLPSNVLLALVALAPTAPLAVALLLARQALSQMDVPTRQAYTMALVAPEERTAAASVTSLARSAGSSISPTLAGALLQAAPFTLGAPLLLAGALKIAYDLAVWLTFRRVRLPDDA